MPDAQPWSHPLPARAETGSWLTRAAELVAVYGPAAYILTLPLEFTAALMRQQLSRFVLVVVGAAFIYLLATRRRSFLLPRSASALALVVLVGVSVVSWLVTSKEASVNELVDITAYPVVALLMCNLVVSRRDHRRAWVAFLASAFGVAGVGALLYVFHGHIWTPNPIISHRLNITFADPNITARFLTLGAAAAVFLHSERQSPAWLTFATAATCAVVLPMTYSRSGLALFVIVVVIAVAVSFDRRRAMAIGGVALLTYAISTSVNPDTRSRALYAMESVTQIATHGHASGPPASSGQGASALDDNRRYLIAAGLTMFKDHPIAGVGFGGYQHALLTRYRGFLPSGYTDSLSHTALVTVLAEEGLIGLVLLVAFLLLLARESIAARRRHDPWSVWSSVAALMVIPIVLYSQFEARFLEEPYLWLSLGLLYSALRHARGQGQASDAETTGVSEPNAPTTKVA